MGFLGDLIDDVLNLPVKIIKKPFQIACGVFDHEWSGWKSARGGGYVRVCSKCGEKQSS